MNKLNSSRDGNGKKLNLPKNAVESKIRSEVTTEYSACREYSQRMQLDWVKKAGKKVR